MRCQFVSFVVLHLLGHTTHQASFAAYILLGEYCQYTAANFTLFPGILTFSYLLEQEVGVNYIELGACDTNLSF